MFWAQEREGLGLLRYALYWLSSFSTRGVQLEDYSGTSSLDGNKPMNGDLSVDNYKKINLLTDEKDA